MNDQTTPTKKLLVVEDDQYLRELYIDILEEEGFNVDYAVDGEEGYNKMHAGGYDLVLLDIMLPKMDGLKILEKLQRETPPVVPNKAVIVLSNLGQDGAIADAVSFGARGYMIKSDYTPDQVISKVKGYLAS
jgi:two-component system cell cycle response regulator